MYNVPEIPTVNGGTPNPGDDCVPFDVVVQPGFTKGNLGCQGSCEDQTLQEAFYDLEVCGKDLPPGEICERYRMGISMVLKDGSSTIPFSVYLPARSDHFRSNLTTQYKTNKTHGRSIRIDTISAGGNDGLYAKLNINDIFKNSFKKPSDLRRGDFEAQRTMIFHPATALMTEPEEVESKPASKLRKELKIPGLDLDPIAETKIYLYHKPKNLLRLRSSPNAIDLLTLKGGWNRKLFYGSN